MKKRVLTLEISSSVLRRGDLKSLQVALLIDGLGATAKMNEGHPDPDYHGQEKKY
jgi:hypothetical protein